MAVPSSGVHSNGYSLVRTILKRNKISNKIKNELLVPTKIYSSEILKLSKKKLHKCLCTYHRWWSCRKFT